MQHLDAAKAQQLARAVEAATRGGAGRVGAKDDGRDDVPALLALYYRHVAPEDIVTRDPVDLCGAALSHQQMAQERLPGQAMARAFTPTVEENGWASGHTLVQVVTDDMPFLVDSVTAELTRRGSAIHLVVHPQVEVRRDRRGRLLEVGPPSRQTSPGRTMESWMSVEIDRVSDPEALEGLTHDLVRVLDDVRKAVTDWPAMREQALRLAAELGEDPPVGVVPAEVEEARELLRWLAADHFTFLGYREYRLTRDDGRAEDLLQAVPGSGLGILRGDAKQPARLPGPVKAKAREPRLLVLTKANTRSTVHRPVYLDYAAVKVFDKGGRVVGERRFLGLFTSAAYNETVLHVPVVRRVASAVLERSGFSPTGHSGRDLLEVLETYPRDELFQVQVDEFEPILRGVLHLQERRQLRLFLRRDDYARYVSALVYLPRDRYTTEVRLRIEQTLREAFDADSIDYSTRISESVLARLHFVVRCSTEAAVLDVDPADLERRLAEGIRSWGDDFSEALVTQAGEEEAARLLRVYDGALPEAYKEDFPARVAVADLRRIDALDPTGALAMNLYTPYDAGPGERRLKLFRSGPVSLSVVLPMLQRMGVEVTDERPYVLTRADGARLWIYDFGLRCEPSFVAPAAVKELFQEAFAAVWSGAAESDGLNALVLRAGLGWRQVMVVRAYAKYLRQAGTPFGQDYLESCLLDNVAIVRLLVQLFEARFHPAQDVDRSAVEAALVAQVRDALDGVANLDQDRILRSLLTLVCATTRTNYFQRSGPAPKPYLTLKLDPHAIPELPRPRPRFEIWVYSPRTEGVHLRFGRVARGGLRWSDRREDFRTEVLGLVKAQMVKNAVIVPVGAKGGFVVKCPPADPTDRDAVLSEGVACYRVFISGLLDVTDNLMDGRVVPPADVVSHDAEDPYLVVAADKGTATFSDIANEVAAKYGFWLGDAFASGGSTGYDHKDMGITARGAWESVKRHFREMGHDTQSTDFTVAGVGDMSGDVFGNGMPLSEHIRLVAAFDHRHVFLDPNPDAAISYAERRRLFDRPRSSWADYSPARISAGGGIYPRTAKSVPISAPVRARLALPEDVASLTPTELVRAILIAPVDLFWNGGIGTYVKATAESNAEIADKANDAVRVDGVELRARVVGEGGNLGFSQRGRIEYARHGANGAGGRINTDAIDNSAGVDTSDHEVNIKILLDRIARDGDLTDKQRNVLLADMTDDVANLVLRDNVEQNVVLGVARAQAPWMLPVHRRFLRYLENQGDLDRVLEFLPDEAGLDRRAGEGRGLTSPEFAVLLAYAKISLTGQLQHSDLADLRWFSRALLGYFPPQLARYADQLELHPLWREIITTAVVNDLVNRAGITFAFRAQEETGAAPAEIARAYTVASEVFGLPHYWTAVESLRGDVPVKAATALHLEGRRLVDRTVRWLLQSRRSMLDVPTEIARFAPVAELTPLIPDLVRGTEQDRLRRRAAEYEEIGAPAELALAAAALLDAFSLLDIIEIANGCTRAAEQVASLYFALSERFEIDRMLTRITALPRGDRWQSLARSALRYDLYTALAGLTSDVIAAADELTFRPDDLIDRWEQTNAEGLARTRATLTEIAATDRWDLAALSVALRVLRTLVRA